MNMNLIIFDIYEFSDAFWLTNSYPILFFLLRLPGQPAAGF